VGSEGKKRQEEKGATHSFQHSHDALLVIPKDTHNMFTRNAEAAFDVANLHSVREHTCEAERYLFRIFVTLHRNLKAVAEVDVDDLARNTVKHQVTRMTVAKPKDVAYYAHDTQGSSVVRATLEPGFGRLALEPEYAVQVLPGSVVQGITEYLYFLHQSQIVIIWSHL
jgi:hypothetical protein